MTGYRASCDTCGFDRTYKSEGKATYALRLHSCAKQLADAERRARRLAREAAVDRTPKPCMHKVADHRHGTRAAYVLDRCRCIACSKANAAAEGWRSRQKAYGRYDRYVDADEARAHVLSLMDQGMGWKQVARASDVSHGGMGKLLYGKRRADGSRQPSRRVLSTTAARILATELELADGALVDAKQAKTVTVKIRALVALGWSQSKLCERLGINRANFHLADGGGVLAGTARAVDVLYDELSMRLPPEDTHRDRIAASRARAYAARRGWLPPLAFDEDLTPLVVDADDDVLDEQAIWRRMQGDRSVRLTEDEKLELIRRWKASGRSLNECERLTGLNVHRQPRKAA